MALLAGLLAVAACRPTGSDDGAAPTTSEPATTVATTGRPAVQEATTTSTTTAPLPAAGPDPAGWSQILGRPEATSIALSVLSERAERVEVAYQAQDGTGGRRTTPVDVAAGRPAQLDLDGLRPATAYRYVVLHDGRPGAEHRFRTAAAPGTPFTFTIDADPHFADPRFDGAGYRATLTNAVADRPDLHVDLGDTFMTEKGHPADVATATVGFAGMHPYLGVIGADAPLYLVNGNHEGELGWLTTGVAPGSLLPRWSADLRQTYYPTPVPSTGGAYSGATTVDPQTGRPRDAYYSWTWGDARFIVLDPFWYTVDKPRSGSTQDNWNWTLGRAQYDWLRTTLQTNRSPYVFVFTHHLVGGAAEARGGVEVAGWFEWGGRDPDGTYRFDTARPGWGEPIHAMLVRYGVTAVFHGHDHLYAHQTLDGIAYQEVPQPSVGPGNAGLASEYGYLQGTTLPSSGHLRVLVGANAATVEYVKSSLPDPRQPDRPTATVADRYELAPRR